MNEMVRWHRRLNGCEFEQIMEDSEGHGSLECCSPWGRKQSDTTERQNKELYGVMSYVEVLKLFWVYFCE